MQVSDTFTKEHTLITKGILIIMMLIHHLFLKEYRDIYGVSTVLSNTETYGQIVWYCKMCISGFAFLSAFGMTRSFMSVRDDTNTDYLKFVLKRIIKLEAALVFVYVIAILFKRFIMLESIREVYDLGNGFRMIYVIIDMLGLFTYFSSPTINPSWWYMTFAILLVIAMPFVYVLYRRHGIVFLIAGIVLPYAILNRGASLADLLPSICLGTAFAYERWFEKLSISQHDFFVRFIRIGIELLGICFSYFLCVDTDLLFSYPFAFLIPMFVFDCISYIPVLNNVLKFIGKHSTNVFLTHVFIQSFFTDYVYSFKKDWLILLVLLSVSVVVSVLLEMIKKVSGYNWVIEKLCNGILIKRND